jgi:hypothetical protein
MDISRRIANVTFKKREKRREKKDWSWRKMENRKKSNKDNRRRTKQGRGEDFEVAILSSTKTSSTRMMVTVMPT